MNIFEVGKKENIGKEYNVYRQGICIGKWVIRRIATSNEFEFYNKKDERMSDIYYTSQILEMEFEEIIDWSKAPVDAIERRIKELKELIELRKGKSNTNLSTREIIDSYKNKNDEEDETVDRLIEKQIKKRMKESDLIFKYFGRF